MVADKLAAAGFSVTFQCHPAIQPLVRRHQNTANVTAPEETPNINLDDCYEHHPHRTKWHFSDLFLNAANIQLQKTGLTLKNVNCRASLKVDEAEKVNFLKKLSKFQKPWIWICPRSQSWVNRTIPPYIWEAVASRIPGTKLWLGTDAPPKGIQNMGINRIGDLAVWLACGDLLVTVDTGPLHIAAAVGCPAVAIEQASAPELHLSDQRDFVVLRHPDLDCLNCQKNVCPKSEFLPPCQNYPPELIAEAINKRLASLLSEDVSCVIPTFRAPVDRLNQCIDHVKDQVSEVIVTCDAGGVIPDGARKGDNIRYVKHRLGNLGFGKNVNFGVRHANGKYVLILNDDVFLRPDAVPKLRECMKSDVGIVGHLLYYADGTIQHGGKHRNPGMRGWGHTDHRLYLPTVTKPHETENVTGASILVQRKAFYAACGFDERFHLYAEDDAFCLQVRQKGYKVMYTPHASGTHLESQTTKNLSEGQMKHIREGNQIFWETWGWWIEKNLNTVPGVF